MKTRRILVAVDNSPAALARVESAVNLANIIEADVTAILAIHLEVPPVAASTMHGGWYMGEEILNNSRQEAIKSADMIHEACELLAERLQWDLGWIQKEGDAVQVIGEEARYHDLLVLGRPDTEGTASGFRGDVHAILLEAGVPCLVMPDASPGFSQQPRKVVLAWDGGREACQAMRGGLGFLMRAEEVIVLTLVAHEDERSHYEYVNGRATDFLSSHGASARGLLVDKEGLFNGPSLIQQAEKLAPDMIVMGAYGHSRFRETILGGATRYLLQQAAVPVMYAH